MSENRKLIELESGSKRSDDSDKPFVSDLDAYTRMRFGYHMMKGAKEHGRDNWRLGQPNSRAIAGIARHLCCYELGLLPDEDHLSAMIFGIQLILMNEQKEGVAVDKYK